MKFFVKRFDRAEIICYSGTSNKICSVLTTQNEQLTFVHGGFSCCSHYVTHYEHTGYVHEPVMWYIF